MTVTGSGSALGATGTQYNFAEMTNSQAYKAAQQLGSEGKITGADAGLLTAMASDGGTLSVPIDPSQRGQSYMANNLNSATPQNYLNILKNDVASSNADGMPLAAANYQSALTDLTANQTTTPGSTIGGTISTTA
jgi:hypothetical protein